MTKSTTYITKEQERYRQNFTTELANIIGCEIEKLPTATSKEIACEYLGLANAKTLDVWHCNGRHGIVMVKVGKYSRPSTEWLINLKLSSLSIAEVVVK